MKYRPTYKIREKILTEKNSDFQLFLVKTYTSREPVLFAAFL